MSQTFAAGSGAYLWQLLHGDRLTLQAYDGRFSDVVFSPDGQTLAGLERSGRIRFWDRCTGQLLQTAGGPTRVHFRI